MRNITVAISFLSLLFLVATAHRKPTSVSPWVQKLAQIDADAGDDAMRALIRDTAYLHVFPNGQDLINQFNNFSSLFEGDGLPKFIRQVQDQGTYPHEFPLPSCQQIPRQDLAVIFIAGQSNASTSGGGTYDPKNVFYQLRIQDGKCYRAVNPLLGMDIAADSGQSFGVQLADSLIQSGVYKNVLLVPIAVSGTYIQQWVPEGNLNARFDLALKYLRANNLNPTHLLWVQGEANRSGTAGTSPDPALAKLDQATLDKAATLTYKRAFLRIAERLRTVSQTNVPIFMAVTSWCGSPSPPVEKAQAELVDEAVGIFPGANLDSLGAELRRDNCHFTAQGIKAHADLWLELLQSFKKKKNPPREGLLTKIVRHLH